MNWKSLGILFGLLIVGLFTMAVITDEDPENKSKDENEKSESTEQKFENNNTQKVTSPFIPKNLTFVTEKVPLEDREVFERLDKEMIVNQYWHSSTILVLKRAKKWQETIVPILQSEMVPLDFFYLAMAESALDNARSPVGAQGFWQFMPQTGKSYELEVNNYIDERNHPVKSTYAACNFIKDTYRSLKNWTLVAAAYNMGLGGVKKQMEKQKVSNYYDLQLNKETSRYVFRVIAFKLLIQKPEVYGYEIKDEEKYSPLDVKYLLVEKTIPDLVDFALEHKITYKELKYYNPWLIGEQLPVKNKPYLLTLPKKAITNSSEKIISDNNLLKKYFKNEMAIE